MQTSPGPTLDALLEQRFGHSSFRAGQREVCQAVAGGCDALLVMPTGAGKSLCYQLPGLARQGTTLVISPLIALMEDQSARLQSLGTRVARIHSGLSRDDARQACREYLDGALDFLFIAPERLRVAGFSEMLARRKPTLLAIDEAHCISQWGHDFRADYRMLGQHVAALRPAPVIALTATATPQVQQDIVAQLGLQNAQNFIHGFRRDNLAIEVVEVPRPRRTDLTAKILTPEERRPAIVYTSSRKDADMAAAVLARDFRAAPYHAGMLPQERARVQRQFLAGELEIVVATVAFGMGVDKADIRTVIHAALPGTLEAYYQEIGRAGRDGLPSRVVMMHSYGDRKIQEFFLEQDYPPPDDLAKVHRLLSDRPASLEQLQQDSHLEEKSIASAVDRLTAHGGALVTMDGSILLGPAAWRTSYEQHIAMRRAQIDQVIHFTRSGGCRMAMLVRHFGDTEDAANDCGECDWCNPRATLLQPGRDATDRERAIIRDALAVLAARKEMSTGKLQQEIPAAARIDRKDWESLLAAAMRAGILFCEEATFLKDGQAIAYRKVSATFAGRRITPGAVLPEIVMPGNAIGAPPSAKAQSEVRSETKAASATYEVRRTQREADKAQWTAAQQALEQTLREWRLDQAKTLKQPAFFIFSDALLHTLVRERPRTLAALRNIAGFGPMKVDRFGEDICRICEKPAPAKV
jgi:ATP-dependent DNA helicase RecQ